jgi:hypothetical protein
VLRAPPTQIAEGSIGSGGSARVTIAACYVSPEGIFLGADSTTAYSGPMEPHYYNNSQKLFEIGEGSTLGVVTWGLGGLALNSYRRLFARLDDELTQAGVKSFDDVVTKWNDLFWSEYTSSALLKQFLTLAAKKPFDPSAPMPDPNARTKSEEDQFQISQANLGVGFCIAGYVKADRSPAAAEIIFQPGVAKPNPVLLPVGFKFWGAPNMIRRLIFGHDERIKADLIASGKWNGTEAELDAVLTQYQLTHPPTLPIRDAIDFVNSCIYSTIKALKFSNLSQVCGGPIELAVITADRPFRWVRHKDFDSAMREHAP